MRHVIRIVAVIALWAVAASPVVAQSAATTTKTQATKPAEPTKAKPSLLFAYLERSQGWFGAGDINSVAANGWDGSWWALQIKRQVKQYNDGSVLNVFLGYNENTGDSTVQLDPALKLGATTTYRGVGDEVQPGIEYGSYFDGWYDFGRINLVFGNETGQNTTGYRQKTDYTAVDLIAGTIRLDHDRRWFSETDLSLHYRRQISADKDSSFAGKPLSRDPVDSHSAWEALLASDVWAMRWNKELSRFAVGALYERSHWQNDGSDRDRLGLRLRVLHRTAKKDGKLFIFDLTPYKSFNTGVDDFGGLTVSLSTSF